MSLSSRTKGAAVAAHVEFSDLKSSILCQSKRARAWADGPFGGRRRATSARHRRTRAGSALRTSWAAALALVAPDAFAADLSDMATKVPPLAQTYDWTGFYVGGHIGLATGRSNWTANATTSGAPPVSGSLDMYRSPDAFYESGMSFGLQY
jgi:hypothetical protein